MKRSLVLPALLLLVACGDSPEELFAKGQSAYAAHDYTAARLHLTSALQEQPGNRAMLALQARTLVALGDGEGARGMLDKLAGGKVLQGELAELAAHAAILRRQPEQAVTLLGNMATAEAHRLRALAALQRNDLDAAGQYLSQAAAVGGNARAFADYARYFLTKGEFALAESMAGKAHAIAPDEIGTLLVRAELATRKGDLAAALRDYEKADKLYPGNRAAQMGRASVLGDLGRLDELEAALKPLMSTMPKDKDVAYLRARLAHARKDWKGIRGVVQPLEANLSQQDPLRLIYAEALLNLNAAEQAIAQAGPIARANPANRHAVRLLAEAQLAAGDARTALATFQPVAASSEARPEELALMARIARAAGDTTEAQYASRAGKPAPEALGADLAEGDAAMRAGNWMRAIMAYERILAVTDGRNAIVLNNMAYAQSMLGNHDKARDFADRAMKLLPQNASVLDTAGWVRFRAGKDLENARKLLGMAAEKAPQNATIRQHLVEASRSAS